MASFSVVNNIASVNAQANLVGTNNGLQKALNRLSSGFRINYAGDDAAGLAVANAYRSDIAVLTQGIRNANDGLSDLQIKDGALNNISTLLDRLSTLATQAASGGTPASSYPTLDAEFQKVLAEIDREAGVATLTAATSSFSVFLSNAGTVNSVVSGTFGAADTTGLGIVGQRVDTIANAKLAVAAVKSAITDLGDVQGAIGSLENRLQFAISLSQSQVVNNRAAESRIRDANIAEESANMTRFNILTQSGIAALSQANQTSSAVLALLR
jgi:flagellin